MDKYYLHKVQRVKIICQWRNEKCYKALKLMNPVNPVILSK